MELRSHNLGLVSLTDDECWRFLRQHRIGRLAFVHAGLPAIFPVNFAVDGESVIMRVAPGSKLAAAARGQRVAFEVDEATESLESGASVVVHGVLRRVTDSAEIGRLERLPLRPWAPGDRNELIRVEPALVTGRRIDPRDQKEAIGATLGS